MRNAEHARAAALRAADAAGSGSSHADAIRRRDARRAEPLLWMLVLALALAIVLLPFAVSQDGPSHVYNGRLFVDWWSGRDAFARDWHERTPGLTTNWTGTLLYAALAPVDPDVAEKLAMLVAMVAVAAGWRHFLRARAVQNAFVLPAGALVAAGAPLFLGFTTYLLGLGVALAAMGEVERWSVEPRARRLWSAALLLLVAWASNPVCWALAAGWTGCAAIVRRDRWRALALLLPGVALAVHFLATFGGGGAEPPLLTISVARFLIPSSPFYALHVAAWLLGSCVLWGTVVLAAWLLATDAPRDAAWRARVLAVLGVTAGMLLAPDRAFGGGGSIVLRMQTALLIVSCAAVAWGRPLRIGARGGFVLPVLAGGYVVALLMGMVELQPALREHATMRVNGAFVSMRWDSKLGAPGFSLGLDPMLHQGARLATRARVPWLANYETSSRLFPLSLRRGAVAKVGGAVEKLPPCADLDADVRYGALVAREVVTWGFPERTDDLCAARLLAQLSRAFEPVMRSAPRGIGMVWRRR